MKGLGCSEYKCKNKFFRMDRLTETKTTPLCRKHWYMYNLGLSEYEASKR